MQLLLIALLLQPCNGMLPGHEGIRCSVSPVADSQPETQTVTNSPVASTDDSDEDTDTDDDSTPDTGGKHHASHTKKSTSSRHADDRKRRIR